MARLHVRDEADWDLDEIAEYIARDRIDAAIRFLEAVRQAYERIAAMPGIGTLRRFANPVFADLRSWPVTGFENILIFYRPVEDGVEIVRVLHGARNLDRIL